MKAWDYQSHIVAVSLLGPALNGGWLIPARDLSCRATPRVLRAYAAVRAHSVLIMADTGTHAFGCSILRRQ